jgi:hypothetical protein
VSVQVQGPDGATYQFPDGTDKNAAIAYFKKKGIGAPKVAPTPGAELRAPTQRERFLATYPVGAKGEGTLENVKNMAQNAGVGIFQTADALVHPVRTVGGILSSLNPKTATPNPIKQVYDGLNTQPGEFLSNAAGQAAATAGAGEAFTGALRSIPKIAGRATEAITGTGPRATKDLVKETQAENETAAAKAADKNTKQAEDRKVDLKKHFDKTQAAKDANEQSTAPVARKEALNRGVEQLDVKFQEDLGALRKKVNEKADAKYAALNSVLDAEQANPEFLPSAVQDAMDKIKGSDTEPTILKDMSKKTQHGDVLTYRDLQGYYSELGRELQKGTLPGDVYYAYDTLQEAIGNEMQNVANRKGMGPQLSDARQTWRQMKQTFYDPKSPLTKALKAGERGKSIAALSGADQTGIEALAKYDPELARRANTIRGHQAEAKSIPAKPKPLKSLPNLAEKPEPAVAEVKKIGPAEIQQGKLKGLERRTAKIRSRGEWIATGAAGYRAISNILHGNLAAVPPDLMEGAIAVAGVEGVARLLENPKVVEFLTKPTERDLAQVPPDLRADMSQVAQIAAKKGIKVDPRIYAAAGAAAPKKRVAAALSQ